MKKRLTMLLACFFLMVGGVIAQTKVNGTVTSQEDGEPVIGASVLVVGTQVGTVTDANGKFSLTCPAGKNTLRITYVGMEPIEVSARPNMRIVLTSDSKALDEVIVVAYGTQKKSSFTGSAQSVGAEEVELRPITSVTKALEGNVSGVQMTSGSGQPGESPKIHIRGFGSINASSDPLYVLDGIPYDGDLASINPSDIESMTVLKDASSSALYGARGANGVVMITTKKGKEGRVNVTWRSNVGWSTVPTSVMTMSARLISYSWFMKHCVTSSGRMAPHGQMLRPLPATAWATNWVVNSTTRSRTTLGIRLLTRQQARYVLT
jgi:TonB-dependent SusC/RagA subfamily outer membrane receptor